MGEISAPQPLGADHVLDGFISGEASLDEWLRKRALGNQESGASRTFVVTQDSRVVAYYSLATGSVERLLAPGAMARNMPDPIPVIVLARLAVDRRHQGRRLGVALLRDAMLRTLAVADQVGVRCLLVHALSDKARRFYARRGFQEARVDPMTLMLPLAKIRQRLGAG